MLQQILQDLYVEPELLAELDEEQKQLLLCKMREEQVRRWKLMDEEEQRGPSKRSQNKSGKKVSFLVGSDGEPAVVVLGAPHVDTILQERARTQTEREEHLIKSAADEELDRLVRLSRSTVQQMEEDVSVRHKLESNPARSAVVRSLQEATMEMELKIREGEDDKEDPKGLTNGTVNAKSITPLPSSDITSPPSSDITSPPSFNITSPPSSDITSPPSSDITSPPSSDITSPPSSDITSPPSSDITSPPSSDITSPPSSDITSLPSSDITSLPSSDISSSVCENRLTNGPLTPPPSPKPLPDLSLDTVPVKLEADVTETRSKDQTKDTSKLTTNGLVSSEAHNNALNDDVSKRDFKPLLVDGSKFDPSLVSPPNFKIQSYGEAHSEAPSKKFHSTFLVNGRKESTVKPLTNLNGIHKPSNSNKLNGSEDRNESHISSKNVPAPTSKSSFSSSVFSSKVKNPSASTYVAEEQPSPPPPLIMKSNFDKENIHQTKGVENNEKNTPSKETVEILTGVSDQIKRFESLSANSLEALKTATLERARKKRQAEILEHLRHQVELAKKQAEKADEAWHEQERRAKAAESRIRDIARRAREEHRRTSFRSGQCEGRRKARGDEEESLNESEDSCTSSSASSLLATTNGVSSPPMSPLSPQSRSLKPPNRESIIKWFKEEELVRGAGLNEEGGVWDWFHGIISRGEAEQILSRSPIGAYLVRVSERIWGYAISYRSEERCRHYLIDVTEGQYTFLGSQQDPHDSLDSLIKYHQKEPITTSGGEVLTTACGQSEPASPDYKELFQETTYSNS